MRYILILILLFFIFSIQPVNGGINTSALWRSALLPGCGQQYKGNETKAYLFFAINQLLVTSTIITYINSESKYNEYINSTSDFNTKWDNYKTSITIFKIAGVTTGLFYLYNLIDAAFIGNSKLVKTSHNSPVIDFNISLNKYQIKYSRKF